MKLTFHGGAQSVTGANYLLEAEYSPRSSDNGTVNGQKTRILIDCGLQQGSNFSERKNWDPFPYDPASINAVFLSHAHIDHSGRLAKLVKDGFHGAVYSTPATRDFAELLLLDSDHILEKEAEHFHKPILFDYADVSRLMTHWRGLEYHQPVMVGPFKVTMYNAGHILGSSFFEVSAPAAITASGVEEKIIFSGDLGNAPAPLIGDPEVFHGDPTYALIESAYGDRLHEQEGERREILERIVAETVRRGGTLMIPAFAMERTQALLFELDYLVDRGRLPKVPIFLDSPLAIKLTDVYARYRRYFAVGVLPSKNAPMHFFNFSGLQMTSATAESKAINNVAGPKIIIAGSGMSHGGRILHHEQRYLPDPKSTLLIIGYQAYGSLGRQILDGAKSVKIFGNDVAVNCRVEAIGGYSAHADQKQLLQWLSPMRLTLKKLFVVQGEPSASQALARKATEELGIKAEVPNPGQEVVI